MEAEATIRAYYDALVAEDPLGPFFADATVGKFGIGEHLQGADAVREGLRAQTETTTDWAIDSRDLRVRARDCHAWFTDEVGMAWTDTERGIRFEFDTRWSGTLERDGDWQFVGMHVSTAGSV